MIFAINLIPPTSIYLDLIKMQNTLFTERIHNNLHYLLASDSERSHSYGKRGMRTEEVGGIRIPRRPPAYLNSKETNQSRA